MFWSAIFRHALADEEARRFWVERFSDRGGKSNQQSVSQQDFMRELQRAISGIDVKTSTLVEGLLKNWVVRQGRVYLVDFGDLTSLFGPFQVRDESEDRGMCVCVCVCVD